MPDTLINTRAAKSDHELTVHLMADALHTRGADLADKSSVVNALTGAGFRAASIELLCESAALTAWHHYGVEDDEFVVWGGAAA